MPQAKVIPPGLSKSEFYQRDLVPLLDKAKKQNVADADKAVERLHEEFDRFRAGIPGFVEDVSSWSTRFGVVRRMSKDKWTNFWKAKDDPDSEEVKKYVLGKFQANILSEDALQKAVESAIGQFKDDATANRNLLLREMKMALSTSDVRLDFPAPNFEAFQKLFEGYVTRSVQNQAHKSIQDGVVTVIASGVAGAAAEQLVAQIIQLLGTEAVAAGAEAAAAGGSSMAAGGGLGAASGWLGGPPGAIIGVGAGLAIGAVVDWWLTERFKTNLTQELTTYLNNLERDMLDSAAASGERPARTGLRETLHRAADKLQEVQSKAVLKALTEAT
jgi:hypothetical protein